MGDYVTYSDNRQYTFNTCICRSNVGPGSETILILLLSTPIQPGLHI